ncbi:MAG: nicotinate-nucleotide adenylyltransferase [Firmicutes bacterium]|nr:nicotinate-nucleotide adenylyltransferase [Bacillota bacterium]
MKKQKKTRPRWGLMGGSFDPIHYGHLLAAQAAARHCSLSQVIFIPTGNPPHKPIGLTAPAGNRYEMTLLATGDNPLFQVSDLESARVGYSYTFDTLTYFRNHYPQTELFFITGADAILDIHTWKNGDILTEMCHFIAISRPGFDLAKLEALPRRQRERIIPICISPIAISSTEIRESIAAGRDVSQWTPKPVLTYIQSHGLYQHRAEDMPPATVD